MIQLTEQIWQGEASFHLDERRHHHIRDWFASPRYRNRRFFMDDFLGHLTPEGYAIAAEIMFETLRTEFRHDKVSAVPPEALPPFRFQTE